MKKEPRLKAAVICPSSVPERSLGTAAGVLTAQSFFSVLLEIKSGPYTCQTCSPTGPLFNFFHLLWTESHLVALAGVHV